MHCSAFCLCLFVGLAPWCYWALRVRGLIFRQRRQMSTSCRSLDVGPNRKAKATQLTSLARPLLQRAALRELPSLRFQNCCDRLARGEPEDWFQYVPRCPWLGSLGEYRLGMDSGLRDHWLQAQGSCLWIRYFDVHAKAERNEAHRLQFKLRVWRLALNDVHPTVPHSQLPMRLMLMMLASLWLCTRMPQNTEKPAAIA